MLRPIPETCYFYPLFSTTTNTFYINPNDSTCTTLAVPSKPLLRFPSPCVNSQDPAYAEEFNFQVFRVQAQRERHFDADQLGRGTSPNSTHFWLVAPHYIFLKSHYFWLDSVTLSENTEDRERYIPYKVCRSEYPHLAGTLTERAGDAEPRSYRRQRRRVEGSDRDGHRNFASDARR